MIFVAFGWCIVRVQPMRPTETSTEDLNNITMEIYNEENVRIAKDNWERL